MDLIESEYQKLSTKEKIIVHDLFKGHELDFSEKFSKLRKIIFKHSPPTPEEFLNHKNGFISYHTQNGLYDHVRRDFLQAMNSDNHYPVICIYGSTRTGKSVLARLFILYTLVFVNYLRDPHLYFKINKMSKISLWLLSFKEDKTKELLLDPLLILLNDSEKFKFEHFEKSVYTKGVDNSGIIHFSEAGKFGAITTPNLKIATGRDPSSIVGSDIISGVISELTFFKQYAPGFTDETAMEVFTKLRARIRNTIGESSFPCWTYLDSSANDAESVLEAHILKNIKENQNYFFRHYCLWEVRPHLYPIWNSDRTKTFKICIGDGSYPAKIFEDFSWKEYPQDILLDVPIDLKLQFEDDLVNQIRDTAGRPTTSESKLFQKNSLVENIFIRELKNPESSITCDISQNPENLLWNNLVLDYFTNMAGKWIFNRASKEPRYGAVDLAFALKGDVTGLSIGHKEWSKTLNKIIYVCDFNFAILAGEQGINIESVGYFIKDLVQLGGMTFVNFVFDTFQSEQLSQFLTRNQIPNEKQSVDTSLNPYLNLYSLLINEQVKSGKNIFLKNNLLSLYRIRTDKGKEKIDHSKGSLEYLYDGRWETSKCGVHAKDVSDALANWIYTASQDNFLPITCYEDENEKWNRLYGNHQNIQINQIIQQNNYSKLLKSIR